MKKLFITIILSILLMSSVLAVDQYMLGNTSGRGLYRFFNVLDFCTTSGLCLSNITQSIDFSDYYNKSASDARYLQNYTETDPVYSAWDKDYNDITNRPNLSLYYPSNNPAGFYNSSTLPAFSDTNNYSTAIAVSGTSTKTIQIARNGMSNLTTTFTDIDTDTDTNNYSSAIAVSGTSTKTINIARNGMSNLTATFTDIDTDTYNTSAQMIVATAIYNDTTLIGTVNSSLWTNKLNTTDQRYNDTLAVNAVDSRVTSVNNSLYANLTGVWGNLSLYYLVSNPSNYITDGNTNWDNSYGFITSTQGNSTYILQSWSNISYDAEIAGTYATITNLGITNNNATNALSGVSSVNNSLNNLMSRSNCGAGTKLIGFNDTYNFCALDSDNDTYNTTEQMRTAINNTILNITTLYDYVAYPATNCSDNYKQIGSTSAGARICELDNTTDTTARTNIQTVNTTLNTKIDTINSTLTSAISGISSSGENIYVNATYIGSGSTVNALTGTSVQTGNVRAYPRIFNSNVTVNQIMWISNATSGGNCTIGIYNATKYGYPDKIIIDSGNIVNTAVGIRSVDISPVELLKDKLYFEAYSCIASSATIRFYQTTGVNLIMGHDTTDTNNLITGWTVTLAYNQSDGLPDTYPAGATYITNSAPPFIGLRVYVP